MKALHSHSNSCLKNFVCLLAGDVWRHGKDGKDCLHPGASQAVLGAQRLRQVILNILTRNSNQQQRQPYLLHTTDLPF